MKAGRFAEASSAIEESYRLDPRPGTISTLAECEAQRSRLATALARNPGYLALHDAFPPAKRSQHGAHIEARGILGKGERKRVVLRLGEAQRATPAPSTPLTPPISTAVAAYTIGSIGIAGSAIATIMGALAVSRKGTVRDNCDGPACNSTGLKASEELKRFELIRRGRLEVRGAW